MRSIRDGLRTDDGVVQIVVRHRGVHSDRLAESVRRSRVDFENAPGFENVVEAHPVYV